MTPQKNPTNLHTQKIVFLKITKIMKFKTSDAKNDPSLRVYENIKYPPGDGSVFEIFYPWLMES